MDSNIFTTSPHLYTTNQNAALFFRLKNELVNKCNSLFISEITRLDDVYFLKYFTKLNNKQKLINTQSYISKCSAPKKLIQPTTSNISKFSVFNYVNNSNKFNFDIGLSQFMGVGHKSSLQYNYLLNAASDNIMCINTPRNKLLLSTFVELYKIYQPLYTKNYKNISNLLRNNSSFFSVKEPVKYTFDLKAKFGGIPTKIGIVSLDNFNVSEFKSLTPIMLYSESERELKNYDTITRYFMVMDQNRQILNRVIKPSKNQYISRLSRLANLGKGTDADQLNFNLVEQKKVFLPIESYDEFGNRKEYNSVDPSYHALKISNNLDFINSSIQTKEVKSSNYDFYTPVKFNVPSDVSSTQTNIRSKKNHLFNQRLLHTTSVLVLPTKLNITVITNSYDVVHS